MEVGPYGPARHAAFEAILPVVAASVEHPSERLRADAQPGAAAVILETNQVGRILAPRQQGGGHHIADDPSGAGPRARSPVEHANPSEDRARRVPVLVTEELVAAADGQSGGAARESLANRFGLPRE